MTSKNKYINTQLYLRNKRKTDYDRFLLAFVGFFLSLHHTWKQIVFFTVSRTTSNYEKPSNWDVVKIKTYKYIFV